MKIAGEGCHQTCSSGRVKSISAGYRSISYPINQNYRMPSFFLFLFFFLFYFQRLSRTCVATLSSWHMLIIRARGGGGRERAGRQSQSENTNSIKLFKNNFYLLPTRFICCRCLCRCGLSTLPRPLRIPPPPLPMYIYDIGNRELELGTGAGGF